MEVSELMNKKVIHVGPEDPLRKIRELFRNHHFHHVLVMENGHLEGIISDRDLFKALSPFVETEEESLKDQQTLQLKAREFMTSNVLAVTPEIKIHTAAQLMLAKGFSCLPVANEDQRIVGILTLKEVLRHYIKIDEFREEAHEDQIVRKKNAGLGPN